MDELVGLFGFHLKTEAGGMETRSAQLLHWKKQLPSFLSSSPELQNLLAG